MKEKTLKLACLVLSSTGLILLSSGCKKIEPLKLDCNASAPSIYPGDAETVTATASSVAPKKNWDVVYAWSGTGATGNGTSATVSSASLDPGTYTVKADAKEGKKGKEGLKPNTTASCSSTFTVKPFDPPTLNCAASPTTVMSGTSSTITATGSSPQNRPLTYTFSASSGSINGNGNSATLATTGAPAGNITVTCSVQDDKAHTVSATTSVEVQVPPPPPPPKSSTLCSIQFGDKRRPERVNNEAKACLDDVALNAQQKPDATIVVVGNSAPLPEKKGHRHHAKEMTAADLAAQRAVNTKDYLVTDKGIDASRIQVKTGASGADEVGDYLVPSGANFDNDVPGTTAVDESAIKAQPRNPKPHHHKAAAKTTK